MTEDEIVQYIIVNKDLKMGKGKIAAQVAHGAIKGYLNGFNTVNKFGETAIDNINKWVMGSHTKIIVKASAKELLHFKNYIWAVAIYDEGRTQIEKDSLTVVASIPMHKSEFPDSIKKLKLL